MNTLINRKSKIIIGLIMIAPGLITIILFFLSMLIPVINISIDLPLATLFGFGLIAGAITLKAIQPM